MLYLAVASVATQQADRARARVVAMMPSFSAELLTANLMTVMTTAMKRARARVVAMTPSISAERSVAMVTAAVASAWAKIAMQ